MSRPGNVDIQFQRFKDYQNHVARFAAIADYRREHQPPVLMLWGRHGTSVDIEEIMAFHREMGMLEVHVFDSGHSLLDTHHRECAELVHAFFTAVAYAGAG